MRLQSLKIAGFRGILDVKLEFPEQVNVLVGVNGVGKSAVLDCTAILLSRLIGRIRSSAGTGRFFSESDINNRFLETRNEIEISFQEMNVKWTVVKTRRTRRKQRITRLDELRSLAEKVRFDLQEDETAILPLAVYYPVNRAVLDIPLRIRRRHELDRLAAYDQALSGDRNSFRIFFEWFREREDLENERRLDVFGFKDHQLQAVRSAIEGILPGFSGLRIRRSPLRMVVTKNNEELIVNQLSDGEKCTLAMVGDLARRMAIANPQMDDPLKAEAVVLIDEIDLHLHPAWQRHVIPAITKTFPQCQFLLSTHSPQILGHLDRKCIWLLEPAGTDTNVRRPEDAYGQEAGRILEDLMNVPARPREIQDELTELFLAIDKGKIDEARRLLGEIQDAIGTDPALIKADVLIRRKEVLGQ